MNTTETENAKAKPVCNIALCGKEAEWEVELFGKVEHYCQRHRPAVPEKFFTKLNHA
ncbi:MAG: hypothetical protein ABSF82_06445 [Candidatus Bathyarchaeia archaeon]